MKKRNINRIDIAAAAAFAVVLGISGIWGYSRQGYNGQGYSGQGYGGQEYSISENSAQPEAAVGRSGAAAGGRDSSGVSSKSAVILDESQKNTVSSIMNTLKQGNLEAAAEIIIREEKMLQDMFYTTMDGKRYLYDGDSLKSDIEGQGIVFTKAGTVFYGTFKDGKPEGQCTVLQAVNLDAPRYDYSQGIWKDGKMEGEGHTGYCYYRESPKGEARDICKTGTFSGNLMEGEVIYTSMNEKDETSTWKLNVEQGTVVTDDRWDYVESAGEYQLLSEDNDNHAYVLEEDQIHMPMWMNLLAWDE